MYSRPRRVDLRGSALAARRKSGRPRLELQLDDVRPSTIAKYDRMLAQLNTLVQIHGQTTLDNLMKDNAISRHQDVLDRIGENSAIVGKIRQSQQLVQPYMA